MTAHLNAAAQPVSSPSALLNSPGLALVYLTAGGSYLSFTEAADAREVAAACERAAGLLSGPQVTLA